MKYEYKLQKAVKIGFFLEKIPIREKTRKITPLASLWSLHKEMAAPTLKDILVGIDADRGEALCDALHAAFVD